MIDYTIEFTPDKASFFKTIIRASSITEAYLEFVRRFPQHYIITDMTGALAK
jgi:hypothetical protein